MTEANGESFVRIGVTIAINAAVLTDFLQRLRKAVNDPIGIEPIT